MKSVRLYICLAIITICLLPICETKKKKNEKKNPEAVYWKNEFEQELSKTVSSNEKDDRKGHVPNTDALMDKIVDTLTSSEEFLKKINSLDLKITRLDAELHDKTDGIIKQLNAISKNLKGFQDLKHFARILDEIEHNKVKYNEKSEVIDKNTDARLSSIERTLHSIANSLSGGNRKVIATNDKSENLEDVEMKSLMRDLRKNMFANKNECDCKEGRVERSERFPTDCNEIQMQGFNISGIYKIKPEESHAFYVLCDLHSAGGGWTVIQNRFDGSQEFYKSWLDYQNGFGNLAGEFWLGLDKINQLTTQKLYSISIELEDSQGMESYATYSVFTVGPEVEGYRISALGNYHGTAGDSLTHHAGQRFSTWDMDNDEWKDGSCAQKHGGGWWYRDCGKSNLNGYYPNNDGEANQMTSMYWTPHERTGYLTKIKMMIRPLPATHPRAHSNLQQKEKFFPRAQLHPGKTHMRYRVDSMPTNTFFE